MSGYKPGTVALVRISDYPPEIGIRGGGGKWYVAGPRLGSQHGWYEDRIEIVHQLVVLDLDDSERAALRKRALESFDFRSETVTAIEQQTEPPRPEEPTDLAVRVWAAGTTWAKIASWWVPVAANESVREWDWLVERDDFRLVRPC